MIQLDEDFTLTHDSVQWVLKERAKGMSKETLERSTKTYPTYYPHLKLALKHWMERRGMMAEPESIQELKEAIEKAHKRIDELHEQFKDISYGKTEVEITNDKA